MKFKKERHQKFFEDKFAITSEKIKTNTEKEIKDRISNATKRVTIDYKNIKNILSSLGLYEGVFYVNPNDVNFKLLNLNLEGIHQDLVKLNKQEHNENDWAYDNDEFQKIYVLKFDGDHAIVALTYKDSWIPIIVDTIPTHDIYFEGNMAKSIQKEIYE